MRASASAVDEMGHTMKSDIFPTAETPISSLDSRSLSSFCSSVDDDTDPSDSLLLLAPLYIPGSENDEAVTREIPDCKTEQPNPDASSRTWRGWLITLFAGRKQTLSSHNAHKRTDSFICDSIRTESASHPLKAPKKQATTTTPIKKQKPTDSCNHAPRLFPTVILSVCTPASYFLTHFLSYTEISPAPPTAYTGYAVVARDDYVPETVVRGFDVPGSSAIVVPLSKRYNTAANLLDHDRDAWSSWNRNVRCAADLPFGKMRPGYVVIPRRSGVSLRDETEGCEGDWLRCWDTSRGLDVGVEEWPFSQCCYWRERLGRS
ncbi:hypothetical protein COCCADRAFT_26418 [Bipolaris zeicola 26-R-13]|uniref:Uncharacterized protein n=1 Tax=Cochliobolus carbonum (strain 26-R-13) TaxID=930089 RepID=W6Y6Y2_COCC2|nr:uncharacterized protein COCCADRAFT_26418 [Bipolaris zeicola 26-R-13]EUC33180.1 hypothetical protein COCCADRAFT_26418 [Bipolaris zeicola 26-R-13]